MHRWLSARDGVALTFGGLSEAGVGVELDAGPPRLLGTPFAADLDPGQCYRVFPGGQVRLMDPPVQGRVCEGSVLPGMLWAGRSAAGAGASCPPCWARPAQRIWTLGSATALLPGGQVRVWN